MSVIISDKDKEELYHHAADIIYKSINDLLEKQETVVLAIPGGRSMPGIFNKLKDIEIPWKKVHIFMVDERLIPIDDDKSNFKLAKEDFIDELIDRGILPKENIHPFIIDKNKSDFGVSDYEVELKKYGSRYDIILLSSGEDSHIGALYPNHHSIEDESEYYLIMHDSPKPPKDRMTLSRKLLLKSKVAILLFIGEIKRNAYKKFQDKNIDINSCPAKLVLYIEDSYILTDLE